MRSALERARTAPQGPGRRHEAVPPCPRLALEPGQAAPPQRGPAPHAGPPAEGVGVNEAPDDPHLLARLYLADHNHQDGLTLRWWRGEWLRWEGGSYRGVLEKELRADLGRKVKEEFDRQHAVASAAWRASGGKGKPPTPQRVTARLTGDVLHAMSGLTLVRGTTEQPSWLDGDGPFPAGEVLAFRNGLLHLPSWGDGRDRLLPLTPRLFSPTSLPYDFDPQAAEPKEWLQFLGQVWPDDPEAVQTLQEWFGYMLLGDASQQKIGMLVGPKRSGKGTIARMLTRLVGPGNVCNPTLGSLGLPFGLQPLLGKSVAIVSDARMSGRTDAAVVTERLLSISGEDGQTIDRKHLTSVTFKLPIRFTILTNELPRLNDASGALVSRLVLLRMTQTFYGREDTGLTARLIEELPSILLWSLRGWARLGVRGHFLQPASSARLIEDMEDLSSPIGAFLREACEVGAGHRVAVADIFQAWTSWCKSKGREPGNEQVFGRDLRAALPAVEAVQYRVGAMRVRRYEGVRLRDGTGKG